MNALARNAFDQPAALASSGSIMAMAAAVAQELSERWPFAVARLRVSLGGPLSRGDAWEAAAQQVTLGLSGIVDGDERPRVDGVLALQSRMMAIRLAGRKLVAFHPARDLRARQDSLSDWVDCLRVEAVGADGSVLGSVERVI